VTEVTRRLIVNADDFGLTAGINRAIIEAHARGIVTSTTVMANMPRFEEAARLAREHPSLGVGLHFNITQGRPVALPARVPSLTGGGGEFLGSGAALVRRALSGGVRPEEVALELRAQLDKCLAAGLRLTHVDSHQHALGLPRVFDALLRTLPGYGIRALRLPREHPPGRGLSPGRLKQAVVARGLSLLCRPQAEKLRGAGLVTTDAFFGVTRTGSWSLAWLEGVLAELPEGTSELMSHPGYEDEELLAAGTRLRASRGVELRLLTDPGVAALARAGGVRLVNFGHL